ncbi:MAG TPA: hypothetical protein VGE07_22655 [Herpetosiphonaceae bacterium]
MTTDAGRLLRGLQDYQASLHAHRQRLSGEYEALDRRWHEFSAAYEGEAAREFRAHWLRTKYGFEEYLAASERIERLLNDRISALIDAEGAALFG